MIGAGGAQMLVLGLDQIDEVPVDGLEEAPRPPRLGNDESLHMLMALRRRAYE